VLVVRVRGALGDCDAFEFERSVRDGLDRAPALVVVDLGTVPDVDHVTVTTLMRVARYAGRREVDLFVTAGGRMLELNGLHGSG
jgi:hypothetical protein